MRAGWFGAVLLPGLVLTACAARPGSVPQGASTPTAAATTTTTVHGTGTARPFDEDELQDLRTLAESSGRPLEEVLADQRGARELDGLANALEADARSGMVMAGHDPDRPGTAFMSFTHPPAAAVTARLRALPLDTTVTSGLPLPHAELVRYSESLGAALDRLPRVRFPSWGPTALGDAIEVRYVVTGRAPSPAELEAAALAATARWSTGGELKVPVRFIPGSADDVITTAVADSGG